MTSLLSDAEILEGGSLEDPYLRTYDAFDDIDMPRGADIDLKGLSDAELTKRASDQYHLTRGTAIALADNPNVDVAVALGNNPSCPKDVYRQITRRPDIAVDIEGNVEPLQYRLHRIKERAETEGVLGWEERGSAAADPYTPSEYLDRLALDMDDHVRKGVLQNPNATPEQKAQAKQTPPSNAKQLRDWSEIRGNDRIDDVEAADLRARAAKDPVTPADCLERLARDEDPHVRKALLANPAVSGAKRTEIALSLPPKGDPAWD